LALIAASGLAKRYVRTWALRDVDLELADGAITALVGPNGAGKSTLIKLCLGFERPTRGRVLVGSADPSRDPGGAIALIGYVPQTPTLYREMTARDHLAFASSLRPRFDTAYAMRRLSDLEIPLDSRPGQLSGGQAAQLWLAVALGTRAPVLLLDEPLANLDPLARREFLAVVADAAKRDGVTVLLSSHVIWDVEPITDRVLLLADGRVLIHDDVSAVCAGHRVVRPEDASRPGREISTFPDRHGRRLELRQVDALPAGPPGPVGVPPSGDPATLEDVVIGYLSAARRATSNAVTAAAKDS
jgi:ABC-2 type transport system ATP-binding protein